MMGIEHVIELKKVEANYEQVSRKLTILKYADFSLELGEMVALVAQSKAGSARCVGLGAAQVSGL